MPLDVRFLSNILATQRTMEEAGVQMLRAACLAVQNQAKRETRGGFKSGRFVTRGWQSITHTIERGPPPVGYVGSTELHFMFWELGHYNLFTRQFERNRWLTRAMMVAQPAMQQQATAALRQVVTRAAHLFR